MWNDHAIGRSALLVAALCTGAGAHAQSGEPLSAIDWLSESVRLPAAESATTPAVPIDEAPVAENAAAPDVSVTSLDSASPDPVGLLAPDVTGLPRGLWSRSAEETLVTLVRAERVESLPAIQDLIVTLMLAEADAPLDAGPQGVLFLARIDKLLDMGAIEPAQSLLEQAGPTTPDLYRRWFDVSLLTGSEDAACEALRAQPGLAPTYPARVFCLARNGDWTAAALTLTTARALGEITAEEDALLSRFLDPELFDGDETLPAPSRPSPLVFRMREAIGAGLSTANLPRAFAHADLRSTVAWRNQMQAAERLARSGAVSENVLQALYTARVPAASGGVWDRAQAFQRFDSAMQDGDADAVSRTLPDAWAAMERVRIEVPFARLYGAPLAGMELTGSAARLSNRIAMLSPDFAKAAETFAPVSAEERLWQAIALDDVVGIEASDAAGRAVIAAFSGTEPPATIAQAIAEDRLGEALLRTISLFQQGLDGDPTAVRDALAALIAADLTETAQRAALQYLILDRGT